MSHPSKVKGTAWESAIVGYLRRVTGIEHIERRALRGTKDCGDVSGIPGVVIEAKNERAMSLAGWLEEALVEQVNAGARYGVVWHKRRGATSPGAAYVTMTGAQFVLLLVEAGYLRPDLPTVEMLTGVPEGWAA